MGSAGKRFCVQCCFCCSSSAECPCAAAAVLRQVGDDDRDHDNDVNPWNHTPPIATSSIFGPLATDAPRWRLFTHLLRPGERSIAFLAFFSSSLFPSCVFFVDDSPDVSYFPAVYSRYLGINNQAFPLSPLLLMVPSVFFASSVSRFSASSKEKHKKTTELWNPSSGLCGLTLFNANQSPSGPRSRATIDSNLDEYRVVFIIPLAQLPVHQSSTPSPAIQGHIDRSFEHQKFPVF